MPRRTRVLCACLALIGLSPLVHNGAEADPPVAAVGGRAGVVETAATAATATATVGLPDKRGSVLRVVGTELVGQITGKNSSNDTAARWDVHGTDLGHMFWHEKAMYMVFGDTFGPLGLLGKGNWRSNTMARIADPDPGNGLPIATMITGSDGKAKELIASKKVDGDEMTVIPTYGISLGARMFLHYMSVKHWGKPGTWEVGHSGIAYSDDTGQTWSTPQEAIWPPNSGFEQVAFVRGEKTLYTFGIPEGRFGGVKLRRVAPERILVPEAYEYWDGSGWVGELTAAATIVAAPVGELSVAWSKPHRQWLMMYLEAEQRAIVLRTAPQLTGPWSDARIVTTGKAFPKLYAPYIVPGTEIGTHLYYTMSMWDPYNVFLMRSTLEGTVPVAEAGASRAEPKLVGRATQPVIKEVR